MTRRLTTQEELDAITRRRVRISKAIGEALAEDLKLAQQQYELFDLLMEQESADAPGRMT